MSQEAIEEPLIDGTFSAPGQREPEEVPGTLEQTPADAAAPASIAMEISESLPEIAAESRPAEREEAPKPPHVEPRRKVRPAAK